MCLSRDELDEFICISGNGGGPTQNEPCDLEQNPLLCAAEHICLLAMGFDDCPAQGCCTQWCDVDDPMACTIGTSCEPWWIEDVVEPPGPGLDHLGFCI